MRSRCIPAGRLAGPVPAESAAPPRGRPTPAASRKRGPVGKRGDSVQRTQAGGVSEGLQKGTPIGRRNGEHVPTYRDDQHAVRRPRGQELYAPDPFHLSPADPAAWPPANARRSTFGGEGVGHRPQGDGGQWSLCP